MDSGSFNSTFPGLQSFSDKVLEVLRYVFGPIFDPNYSFSSIGPFTIFLFSLSVFFLFVIVYCFVRMLEIRKKEKEHLREEIAEYAHHKAEREKESAGGSFKNQRWENVLNYLTSENPSDWKLAIIEADTILEELTDQLGLDGDNVGERLKATDRERFKSLDNAWEAHLVRNKIAHEGSQFDISQHEANRVVSLYEDVFREFGYI